MKNNGKEHFYVKGSFEVREIGEDKKTAIQGYALKFDTLSEDMGFREIISRGALDDADMSDVIFVQQHNELLIMARNNKEEGEGSLKLTVDNEGLFFEAIPTNTSYARDLVANVSAGVIQECSFRFTIDWNDRDAQAWDWDDGKRGYDIRTIKKIKKVKDVSLVVFPAYKDTGATTYKRAKDDAAAELQQAQEKEKLSIELM